MYIFYYTLKAYICQDVFRQNNKYFFEIFEIFSVIFSVVFYKVPREEPSHSLNAQSALGMEMSDMRVVLPLHGYMLDSRLKKVLSHGTKAEPLIKARGMELRIEPNAAVPLSATIIDDKTTK